MKAIKQNFYLLLLLSLITLNFSCSNYYYMPNDGNLMAVSRPGDIKIAAASEFENGLSRHSFQGAYSPINHISLRGNYFKATETSSSTTAEIRPSGDGTIKEGSIGFYYHLKKHSDEAIASNKPFLNHLLVDAYLGAGVGNVNNFYSTGGQSFLGFRRNFVQLGFHYKLDVLRVGVGIRYVQLNYNKGSLNGDIDPIELNIISDITSNGPYRFIETSFRLSLDLRYASIFSSLNFSAIPEVVPHDNDLFQIGIQANLEQLMLINRRFYFGKKSAFLSEK